MGKRLTYLLLLALVFGLTTTVQADDRKDKKKREKQQKEWIEANRPYKVTGTCAAPVASVDLDVNNVRARLYNNGALFWRGGDALYNIPKRDTDQQQALFASGIWLGGLVDDELRMAASDYGPWEFWPGPLDDNGNPPADCSVYDRMYKVSVEDIKNYDNGDSAIPDLAEWPFELGAPVEDGDGNPNNYDLAAGDRPGIIGDQTIWWIMNDMGNEHGWSQSNPIGLEVQVTAFAFQRADALNNTTFYKYKLINKGGAQLLDTYFGIWSDPDLGNFNDDYVGSDPEKGIGFVWNGADIDAGGGGYGSLPPALGYDYFQGPLVNNDGVDNDEDGEVDEDDERIAMSKFIYYNNDGTLQGNPTSALDAYRYLRGFWRDDVPVTIGGTGRGFSDDATNYMFPGEPPAFWSEENTDDMGTRNAPADRRFLMSSGPFTLDPGAVQEIVYGIVWSQAGDRFASVQAMKIDDLLAQAAFDANFDLPSPPDAPRLTASEIDGSVLLTWGYNSNDNNYIDSYDVANPFLAELDVPDKTYSFEGYRVFSYPNDTFKQSDASSVGVFDLDNGVTSVVDEGFDGGDRISFISARGTDDGVRHSHQFNTLVNGRDYYYGVQAYSYNEFSAPKIQNGSIATITVRPTNVAAANGGTIWNPDNLQADIAGEIVASASDGSFTAVVVDPLAVTGDKYRVEFYSYSEVDDEDHITLGPFITYDIINSTKGVTALDGRAHAVNTGKALPQANDVIIIDGLSFNIEGPPIELKSFETVANAAGPLEGVGAAADFQGFPVSSRAGDSQQADGGHWFIHTWPNGSRGSYDAFLARTYQYSGGNGTANQGVPSIIPDDVEIRFTGNGKAFVNWGSGNIVDVPYEWWNVGLDPADTSDDYQMIPWLFDTIEDDVWTILNDAMDPDSDAGWADHEGSGGANDPWTEPVYVMAPVDVTPGTSGHDNFFTTLADVGPDACPDWYDAPGGAASGKVVDPGCDAYNFMSRTVFFNWNGGDVGGAVADYNSVMPEIGTVFRILANKPNLDGVAFELDAGAYAPQTNNAAAARAALDLMGIVPNPYKGTSAYETNQLVDVARFVNMPENATMRVYTLAGTLVNTLVKSSPETTFDWNLRTEEGLPIASGVYLIHVDVPGVGEKVLKFGVVKKRIQLDVF